MSAYDIDLHAWAAEQAAALRARSANEVDWENVAEEIESLGKQAVGELRSRLRVLLAHLLKWAYQPEGRSRSWSLTIDEQRDRIVEHLEENPSLRAIQDEVFTKAYRDARYAAARQTRRRMDRFPSAPPFTLDRVLTTDWLPEAIVEAEPDAG